MNRNGIDIDRFRGMMGSRLLTSRFWPLLISRLGSDGAGASAQAQKQPGAGYHNNLYNLIDWFLGRAAPRARDSAWTDYQQTNSHYSSKAREEKHAFISKWLDQLKPSWVADFGCNTGEYSLLAQRFGASVIALDADLDCIDKLYAANRDNRALYPVVANLDDMSAGRGWAGEEFSSLPSRVGSISDLSMMLALIHHLAISLSIPFPKIAEFAAKLTRKWLIVELIDEQDPLVGKLCQDRRRSPSEFPLAAQRAAFLEQFHLRDETPLTGTHRHLLLLEKNNDASQ
ncbi:methyltransferase domain-containing protein [Chromobacterium paludis]|uniref:Class I SAM-dependent methyltransferase n=1 Tax=Chromobacterium paludis TaxID=2605945 RepID=A0A5C1DDZ6_9NEIS|nr:class I SAM-dependent methyltransferase [Chromobacterium paludis]QEL54992.1 class I SAM-dependent methyltransferase [Chromobacterium paludis]